MFRHTKYPRTASLIGYVHTYLRSNDLKWKNKISTYSMCANPLLDCDPLPQSSNDLWSTVRWNGTSLQHALPQELEYGMVQ